MRLYSWLKQQAKIVRWQWRRYKAVQKWGSSAANEVPAIVGNAIPKCGSHLIIQVLQGLVHLGPFVNPGFPPLNRSEDNRKLADEQVVKRIRQLRSGDIAYGYIQARSPFLEWFNGTPKDSTRRLMVFIYRDPRDYVISHVFYATQINKDHGLHRYYTQTLHTMEERINAAILGVEESNETDSALSSVVKKYENYLGWFSEPAVLCLKFEDLILEREKVLHVFLDYLARNGFSPKASRADAVNVLSQAIIPKASGTFRRAKPGNWQEHFSEENKKLFKQAAGDLLLLLGYEKDDQW